MKTIVAASVVSWLFGLAVWAGGIYILIHFIQKFW